MNGRAIGLLLCAVVAVCTACSGSASRTVTTNTPDGTRTAIVHRPVNVQPGAPLVIVLHGSGGTGAIARARSGWDAVADREGFVVAYPDGIGNSWNGGACCRPASVRGIDDVGYLHQLVGQLAAEDGIDPRHVVAGGFSNGGIMAFAWACQRPGDLTGIAPLAGLVLVPCAQPGPVSVVAVYGSADTLVPPTDPPPGQPTAEQSVAPFRAGCYAGSSERTGPAAVTTWGCPDGRSVTLELIDGLGHDWPAGAAEFAWERLRPG